MEEIGRIMPRALKAHVQRENAPLLAVVAGLWPRVAGKAIAEQARPMAFSAGALTIASSESWAVQLRVLCGEICAAVNKALGQPLVKRVRVRLARQPRRADGDLAGKLKSEGEADRSLRKVQPGIDTGVLAGLDPETRSILSDSFEKYFARGRRGIN